VTQEKWSGVMVGISELLIFGILVLFAWFWVRIVGKTGYNKWLGLLILVPGANLGLVLFIAFSKWPIERQLEEAQRELKEILKQSGRNSEKMK
jgi:HAMP domain-containing protein